MIEAIEIDTPRAVVLRGEARVAGDDWTVLVHPLGNDLDYWSPLLGDLEDSVSVLAADLRGHGGSEGVRDDGCVAEDVEAMLTHARSRGAELIVVVGAGDVAPAVLEVADRLGVEAVVLLGPVGVPARIGTVPRFVVAASGDPDQVRAAELLQRAPGWSLIANVPTAEAGAELLSGFWGTNVRSYVTAFVRDVRLHHPGNALR